jgi:hypothetical protein
MFGEVGKPTQIRESEERPLPGSGGLANSTAGQPQVLMR